LVHACNELVKELIDRKVIYSKQHQEKFFSGVGTQLKFDYKDLEDIDCEGERECEKFLENRDEAISILTEAGQGILDACRKEGTLFSNTRARAVSRQAIQLPTTSAMENANRCFRLCEKPYKNLFRNCKWAYNKKKCRCEVAFNEAWEFKCLLPDLFDFAFKAALRTVFPGLARLEKLSERAIKEVFSKVVLGLLEFMSKECQKYARGVCKRAGRELIRCGKSISGGNSRYCNPCYTVPPRIRSCKPAPGETDDGGPGCWGKCRTLKPKACCNPLYAGACCFGRHIWLDGTWGRCGGPFTRKDVNVRYVTHEIKPPRGPGTVYGIKKCH